MQVPSFEYCSLINDQDMDLSPLERFVLDHQPVNEAEEAEWRRSLQSAVFDLTYVKPEPETKTVCGCLR